MHIPDGYLGPQTYIPAYAAMVPFWTYASRNLKKTLRASQVPLMALGAAFSFVIMMFNIPVPGGTTGHAIGGALIAILLGPWAAVIAVSLALIIQALMFGDGGITAIGANCLNMAVILPFVGWGVYRLIAGNCLATSPRRWIAGAIGGYFGITAAALSAGIMFGIQPMIARDAAGHSLYCPFGLKIAIPAMVGEHMLIIGFVEAVVTGLVISYLQRVDPDLIRNANRTTLKQRKPLIPRIAMGLGAMALLSPLGLYLPARFAAGSAWGEWSNNEIAKTVGYIPSGMRKLSSLWKAPLPDYTAPGIESTPLATQSLWYIISGAIGIIMVPLTVISTRKYYSRKDSEDADSGLDAPAG